MNIDDIANKYTQITKVVLSCPELECFEVVPILIYSAIDALSWLYSDQLEIDKRVNVGKDFEAWVEAYLLPNLSGDRCTAREMYLARCSALHTFSAIAKNQKKHRVLSYAYGDLEYMKKVNVDLINSIGKHKSVLIHLGHLVDAFIKGTSQFFKYIEENKELRDKVMKKAENYYMPLKSPLFFIEDTPETIE